MLPTLALEKWLIRNLRAYEAWWKVSVRLSVKLLCKRHTYKRRNKERKINVHKIHISYKTIKLCLIYLLHHSFLQSSCSRLSFPKMVTVASPTACALLRILSFPHDEVESNSPPEFGQKYGGREPIWLQRLDYK